MITYVAYESGDEITNNPDENTLCTVCRKKVYDQSRKHYKIASMLVSGEQIRLSWAWACERCGTGVRDIVSPEKNNIIENKEEGYGL